MKNSIFVLLITLISLPLYAEDVPGQQMLSYFSANCRTQGEWTRAALSDSTALIEVLRKIQDDPDCKSVGGAISQLGMLNQYLTTVQQTNDTKSQLAQLNAQEQELLIQVANTTDPAALATINANLRSVQVTRAGLIGKDKASSELTGADKVQSLASAIQVANSAFTQITNNQKCIDKNPSVLNAATTIMASVGATATLVNPALGLGLTAGSEFLGQTIEGIRRNYRSRQIRKISDGSIALEGYKCALETMSERWCQMKDAEAFLLFKAKQRKDPFNQTSLGTAIRLKDREIPALMEWLNRIRSGVTPTTTADADRRNAVLYRVAVVDTFANSGFARIEERRPLFNDADLEGKKNILKALIIQIIPRPEMGGPVLEIYPQEYAPFYLLGLKADDPTIFNEQTKTYQPFNTWQGWRTYNPDIDLVKQNLDKWVKEARTKVNQELNQVLQPDTLQTLSSAFDRTGNAWKISPMDSLKRLIEFLEANQPRELNPSFRKIYFSTLQKLKEVYQLTYNSIVPGSDDIVEQDVEVVQKIYDLVQLKYGTVVLETRLEMIVRLSVLELLENSREEDQVLVAQLLAADRFTETLTRMSGTDNLSMIRADINRAQPITISNLNAFIDVFGKNVSRILEKLMKEEEASTGSVARAKRYSRTELCFQLLAVPDVEKFIDTKLCTGLKFESVVKGGPESVVLNPDIFKKDLNDRACEYREFFRRSKIYETWGIK